MWVQSSMIKALGIFALAGFCLSALAAQADQATALENDASYCEIFQAINPAVPETCFEELGLTGEGGLQTGGPKTRSIRIHEQNQTVQPADHSKSGSEDDLAIAMQVPFLFDSNQLTDEARTILDRVADVLNSDLMSAESILIEGHADANGAETYNLSLSTHRALAVQAYLSNEHGITMDRLLATGKGEAEPYDPANPEASVNRRVEFTNLGS